VIGPKKQVVKFRESVPLCLFAGDYEDGDNHIDEFLIVSELTIIEEIICAHSDCHVNVLAGDFNIDFCRDWSHTAILNSFCEDWSYSH